MKITTEYLQQNDTLHQRPPLIVAFGGGVNSTAVLIGMQQRRIRPDLILFADTGGELPETYEHTRQFSSWLIAHGFPEIVWVSKTFAGEPTTLEADCLRNQTLPSIAFGFKGCSIKYKRDPQDKYCNHWAPAKQVWAAGRKCIKVLGYDADEERRASIADDSKYVYWYPLIEWGWWRDDCKRVCELAGFTPPKSACFFCPNSSRSDIRELARQHPNLFQRALKMEANASLTTIKGLGRRFAWRDVGFPSVVPGEETDRCTEMPCSCYDGE